MRWRWEGSFALPCPRVDENVARAAAADKSEIVPRVLFLALQIGINISTSKSCSPVRVCWKMAGSRRRGASIFVPKFVPTACRSSRQLLVVLALATVPTVDAKFASAFFHLKGAPHLPGCRRNDPASLETEANVLFSLLVRLNSTENGLFLPMQTYTAQSHGRALTGTGGPGTGAKSCRKHQTRTLVKQLHPSSFNNNNTAVPILPLAHGGKLISRALTARKRWHDFLCGWCGCGKSLPNETNTHTRTHILEQPTHTERPLLYAQQ